MVRKSEKLVCAYLLLIGAKFADSFEMRNLLFTAQELIDKANETFGENIKSNIFQNITIGRVDSHDEKLFIRGSEDSLNDYYRLACPNEGASYNLNQLIEKLIPAVNAAVPEIYRNSTEDTTPNKQAVRFVKDYFSFIQGYHAENQETNASLGSKEAVWIAAVTLTYNEYVRTQSATLEQYLFAQNSIARLATVFNSANVMTTCSQVTGQSVTAGKNNQNYSYLIPQGDKRRVSATNEAQKVRPEQLPVDYKIKTIDGQKTVRELIDFIDGPYTSFVENGDWAGVSSVKANLQAANETIINKIKLIIAAYKANFERVNQEERYKWEAIGCYQRNWDIEAENFSQMYAEAFKEASNLLAANMYWPYKMVITFAEQEPDKVRELFKMLYNEEIPLAQRYVDFRAAFDEFYKPQKLNHYQDLHAISVYLSFEYPDKYYIYKYKVFKEFSSNIGYVTDRSKFQSEVYKLEAFFDVCELVLDEVKKDTELQEISAARLDESCYADTGLHLLTHDIVYFGSKNALTDDAIADDWWPSLDEYDPNLSKEDWKKYILEVELPNHPSPMQMLKAMMELNGEASCKRLSQLYGGTVSAYVGCAVNLGKRVKKYFDLHACMDGDQERYFPNPFLGKNMIEDGVKSYCYKIRPELYEALQEIDLSHISAKYEEDEEVSESTQKTDVNKNTILYGPPGTGKTYNTVVYAVAIIENKLLADVKNESYSDVLERYNTYKTEGLIEFTTFHQSYGYEEFIEGIKPVMDNTDEDRSDIQYSIEDGLFKAFCNKSAMPATKKSNLDLGLNKTPTIWKVSLWSTGDNPTRTECLNNGHIRIGWDDYGPDITDDTDFTENGGKNVLNSFIYKMKVGDIVFSCYSSTTIDAIGVVTGDYEWCGNQFDDGLNRMRKVNWIVKGINEDIVEINGGSTMTLSTVYKLKVSLADALALIQKHLPATVQMDEKKNHVFIIDEINRGNISKIFGELITLIESSKRIGQPEGMRAKLPYSQQLFGVPDNVYIIGTMNTADRSISTIDTALRRRFRFKEMMPDVDVLKGISVEDISVSEMLARMNKRISVLYDREHTIGHAYFIPLRDNPTIEQLAEIFENAIVPLLQECFYEDYEKIRLVLGDNNKDNKEEQFIVVVENDYNELFGSADIGFDDSVTYEINRAAFDNIEAYRSI